MKTILALQGLSCMHCVGSVTKALEARGDVTNLKVTIEYAVIESDAKAEDLIATITDAGYEAVIATTPDVELQLIRIKLHEMRRKNSASVRSG
ncbi:Copper-exporting P-type ATPase A [Providencia rustigianii]|nr:Copper-exporting P-type ATPase A [Providencia rustigianii]